MNTGNEEKKQAQNATGRYILVARDTGANPDIRISNMTVRTPGMNPRTLVEGFNEQIAPGQRIVLTGASGSGKSLTAKAILGRHDAGSGLVTIPAGLKVMAMAQQAYFPGDTLPNIMNMAPEGKGSYTPAQMAAALKDVGHEKLIQHLPGQQAAILINDLMAKTSEILEQHKGTADQGALRAAFKPAIEALVKEQFTTVQFVPDIQRALLRVRLLEQMKGKNFGMTMDQIRVLANDIADDIDVALAQPLAHRLRLALPNMAQSMRGRLIPYSPDKTGAFLGLMEWRLRKGIKNYLLNRDTDEKDRILMINARQADWVIEQAMQGMREQMALHTKAGVLSRTFNAVTWPLSPLPLLIRAARAAKELVQAMTHFMDKQVLRGDSLTLSGGERQKLAIAIAQLHKPDVLIVDEITAALDRDSGEALYKQLMERIPATTTVLSIAHNEHIMKYHTDHWHLQDGRIAARKIAPKP